MSIISSSTLFTHGIRLFGWLLPGSTIGGLNLANSTSQRYLFNTDPANQYEQEQSSETYDDTRAIPRTMRRQSRGIVTPNEKHGRGYDVEEELQFLVTA